MKALAIEGDGPDAHWALRTLPDPQPAPSELLIRVMAVGLNRADLRFSRDHYGNTNGVAGGEMAGVVLAVGAECVGFSPGDRVMALAPGCFAELVALDHRLVLQVPQGMEWVEAAAIPAAYITAHDALMRLGGLRPGAAVLVQGATSSVGLAALQLARHFGAVCLLAVARSAAKLAVLQAHFDVGLTADQSWPELVLDATSGNGVDLVFDLVGGEALHGNLACTALQGKIVAVGRLGGSQATLDLDLLAFRRISLIGTTFRSRTVEERVATVRRFEQEALPAITAGTVRPVIDAVYGVAGAEQARSRLEDGRHVGKIVLTFT